MNILDLKIKFEDEHGFKYSFQFGTYFKKQNVLLESKATEKRVLEIKQIIQELMKEIAVCKR